VIFGAMVLAGCSSMGIEPEERDDLAKDEIQLIGDPLEVAIDEHIHYCGRYLYTGSHARNVAGR
jgi:hypothetical protein